MAFWERPVTRASETSYLWASVFVVAVGDPENVQRRAPDDLHAYLQCNRVLGCGCALLETVWTSLLVHLCVQENYLVKTICWSKSIPGADCIKMLSYGRKKSEASLLVAREVEEAVEGPLEMVTKVDVEFTLTLSAPRDVLSDARKILLLNNPSGELPFLIPFKETEASLHFKCLAHCFESRNLRRKKCLGLDSPVQLASNPGSTDFWSCLRVWRKHVSGELPLFFFYVVSGLAIPSCTFWGRGSGSICYIFNRLWKHLLYSHI